jgi:hypothetical protein
MDFKMENEGLRYLTNLQESVKETDTNYNPQEPVGAKETVIHVGVPDDLKKVFILGLRLRVQATKLEIDRMLDNSITDSSITKLSIKSKVLDELFWAALRAEYNSYNHDIAIRKDWTVVEYDTDRNDSIKKFLKGLGGMDVSDMGK